MLASASASTLAASAADADAAEGGGRGGGARAKRARCAERTGLCGDAGEDEEGGASRGSQPAAASAAALSAQLVSGVGRMFKCSGLPSLATSASGPGVAKRVGGPAGAATSSRDACWSAAPTEEAADEEGAAADEVDAGQQRRDALLKQWAVSDAIEAAAAGGIDLPFEGFGGTEQPGGGMGAGGYLWGGEGDGSGQEAAGELIDMSLGAPAAGAATSGELVDVTLDLPDQGASMVTSSFV